jgi:hypothetical protein
VVHVKAASLVHSPVGRLQPVSRNQTTIISKQGMVFRKRNDFMGLAPGLQDVPFKGKESVTGIVVNGVKGSL